jgi:hypothetical protein
VVVLALLSTLAGCRKSPDEEAKLRLDAATTLNVCDFVSQADVEETFGPLILPPQSPQNLHGSEVAGGCAWYFKPASGKYQASLSATFVTHGSSEQHSSALDPWDKARLDELKATMNPNPVAVEGLGDKALLFEVPQQLRSALIVQQGKTFVTFWVVGASSAQLISFAKLLVSKAIAAQMAGTNAKTAALIP